jgi:hypothetical protein
VTFYLAVFLAAKQAVTRQAVERTEQNLETLACQCAFGVFKGAVFMNSSAFLAHNWLHMG